MSFVVVVVFFTEEINEQIHPKGSHPTSLLAEPNSKGVKENWPRDLPLARFFSDENSTNWANPRGLFFTEINV